MLDIETEVSRVRKGSAKGVGARFRASFEFLSRHPGVGRPGRRGTTREWIVPDLPVIVVYRVRGPVLEVVGVYPGVLAAR